jgi:hypothetical protein
MSELSEQEKRDAYAYLERAKEQLNLAVGHLEFCLGMARRTWDVNERNMLARTLLERTLASRLHPTDPKRVPPVPTSEKKPPEPADV